MKISISECRKFWRKVYNIEKYLRDIVRTDHLDSIIGDKLDYIKRMLIVISCDLQKATDEFEENLCSAFEQSENENVDKI